MSLQPQESSDKRYQMKMSHRIMLVSVFVCVVMAITVIFWVIPIYAPVVEQQVSMPTSLHSSVPSPIPAEQVQIPGNTPVADPQAEKLKYEDIDDLLHSHIGAAEIHNKIRIMKEQLRYVDSNTAKLVMNRKISLIPENAAPGDVVLVRHQQPVTLVWQEKTYTLQKFGLGYYAYLPVPITLPPGKYAIDEVEITIVPKAFDTQYLEVSEEMESMQQNTARIEADQIKINKARSVSATTFLFSDRFMTPLEGRLTTAFGYSRYVNKKLSSRHRAIDIAAPEGTPIYATNDGIIALAEELYLSGNAIYIDHGMYLFSQYGHMLSLEVKTGDFVKRGQIIGYVGTTGFSTGPHLHFAFWAQEVPVNPELFFGKTPFLWINTDDAP
jgi:murein DD-endopeptidase MepM/ murein hydrolase activator NlpD